MVQRQEDSTECPDSARFETHLAQNVLIGRHFTVISNKRSNKKYVDRK
jgi:hypothetical protein